MTNRQFRQALKAWLETTWQQIGPEVTADLKANEDTILMFWRNHVDECVALARDAEYIPINTLYANAPTRALDLGDSQQADGEPGHRIIDRSELAEWLRYKYHAKFPEIKDTFMHSVPGLGEFDFIETEIGGTQFRFRRDRLPYHYKKQFRKTLSL